MEDEAGLAPHRGGPAIRGLRADGNTSGAVRRAKDAIGRRMRASTETRAPEARADDVAITAGRSRATRVPCRECG